MKRLLLILPLLLSACSLEQTVRSIPVVEDVCSASDRVLIDEKVVYAAEAFYNVPAFAYKEANEAGQLTPELKTKVKPLLMKLNDLRNAVFHAKGAATCDFAEMKKLQVDIIQLLPKRN